MYYNDMQKFKIDKDHAILIVLPLQVSHSLPTPIIS